MFKLNRDHLKRHIVPGFLIACFLAIVACCMLGLDLDVSLLTFRTGMGGAWSVDFSPDSKLVAAGGFETIRAGGEVRNRMFVKVWEIATQREVFSQSDFGETRAVAF